jgi:hypothetical protein
MKNLFLKTAVVSAVVMLVSKLNVYAQDYVVTLKGDTIPCQLSVTPTGNIKYKTDNATDLVKMNQCCIVDYYIARKKTLKRFVFINSDENEWRPELVNVIENGKISLYESVDVSPTYNGEPSLSTVWSVGKGTDSARTVITSSMFGSATKQSRKDELSKMLMDNKDVYNKYIADDRFSFKQIRNIIHLYNTGEPLKN